MWRWLKKVMPVNEKDTSSGPPIDTSTRNTIEDSLSSAQEILIRDGPRAALEHLQYSPQLKSERVIRWMHAVVWNHNNKLPKDFLEKAFLDPCWCQCKACEFTWLISPLLATQSSFHGQSVGFECLVCHRVLCPQCSMAAQGNCPCGGAFLSIQRPNGRTPRKEIEPASQTEEIDWFFSPIDDLPEPDRDLHLCFGFEGKVPIGVDPTFPSVQTGSVESHIAWAETLLDAQVYYQAERQLDLAGDEKRSPAKAKWLRARLKLNKLNNVKERSRRWKFDVLGRPNWLQWPEEIKALLEDAVLESPELGGAWLTLAQINLNDTFGVNYARALECAQRAHDILGQTPAALLVCGQALLGLERPTEAIAVLRSIPPNSTEGEIAMQELKLAKLYERCQIEPLDIDAHLELGRWCLRHNRKDKAQRLFRKLVDQRPDRPEGYYGLAQFVFLDADKPYIERYNEAHRWCREALNRNSEFGLAYELLGSIFHNLGRGSEAGISFEVEDSIEYYERAILHDPTCDIALSSVAAHHLKSGRLHPARELLEKAAALDTNDAVTYYVLAVIYQGTREFEKQDQTYRKAKELWPEVELDADYQQRILQLCGYEY